MASRFEIAGRHVQLPALLGNGLFTNENEVLSLLSDIFLYLLLRA